MSLHCERLNTKVQGNVLIWTRFKPRWRLFDIFEQEVAQYIMMYTVRTSVLQY